MSGRSGWAWACVLAALAAGGCGPSKEELALAKALSARVDRQPTYEDSARFLAKQYLAKHDKDYVVWAMEYASLCLMGGDYDAARDELLRCFMDIDKRQDTDKETAAALSNESFKIFKGEPFERAMVCLYLGLLHYLDEDYNNARIFFTRADLADATAEEDMAAYRHDIRLAHYWLGRTYLKLGDEGNAHVAFRKAGERIPRKGEEDELKKLRAAQAEERKKRMRLEAQCFAQGSKGDKAVPGILDMSASPSASDLPASLPGETPPATPQSPVQLAADRDEQFLSVDFQKQVNLILVIETGLGPVKYLVGENGCLDAIMRASYPERGVQVYLDGHSGGRAFQLVDLFHQADTRGTSEKDRAQMAKGVTQAILSRMPMGIGSVASLWDVRADDRYWRLMPGEVFVYAAKVTPGLYTVNVQCTDSNGYLLPRFRLTRHYIPVREDRENIYFLHTLPEGDNTYVPKTR